MCAEERVRRPDSIDLLPIWLSVTRYSFLAQRCGFKNSVTRRTQNGKLCGFKSRSPGPFLCLKQILPGEGEVRVRALGLHQQRGALHAGSDAGLGRGARFAGRAPAALPAADGRGRPCVRDAARAAPSSGAGLRMAARGCLCGAAVPASAASPPRWGRCGASLEQRWLSCLAGLFTSPGEDGLVLWHQPWKCCVFLQALLLNFCGCFLYSFSSLRKLGSMKKASVWVSVAIYKQDQMWCCFSGVSVCVVSGFGLYDTRDGERRGW